MHVCPSPDSYLKTFSFVLYNSSQFFLIAGRGEAQSLGPQPAVTPPPLPGKAIMLFFFLLYSKLSLHFNSALAEAEFRQHSHLCLVITESRYPLIQPFQRLNSNLMLDLRKVWGLKNLYTTNKLVKKNKFSTSPNLSCINPYHSLLRYSLAFMSKLFQNWSLDQLVSSWLPLRQSNISLFFVNFLFNFHLSKLYV